MEDQSFILLPSLKESILQQPSWTVLIPTFNCANFLKETLESVLNQDMGTKEMEIIVIDDCSTKDDPERVVKDIGRVGLSLSGNQKNVGKVRNYETGLLRSKGRFIHQLHGDDKVRPGFYIMMEELFRLHPDAMAGFCRSLYVDENNKWKQLSGIEKYEGGILDNWFEKWCYPNAFRHHRWLLRGKYMKP
ncbi:MAG: glycosyltransferase family 2 protein [Chloroflexia bacterium]|nr:glycosyltransferase family 2 protein [Chloroflexia bacterium]